MDLSSVETWRWIWLAAAVGFTIGELLVAGSFFLAPFAVAAAAACVVAFAGGSVLAGWVVFVVASIAASAVLRPLAKRLDRSSPVSDVGVHRWVGRVGLVLDDIPGGPSGTGLVRLDREQWRAESESGDPIPAGASITVSRVDGTRLVVREHTV